MAASEHPIAGSGRAGRGENVTDVLARHAAERPQGEAVIAGDERLTWAGLRERVEAAAAHLRAQGLRAGDRVALSAPDGIPAHVLALAVLHAGGVHAPLDHAFTARETAEAIAAMRAAWSLQVGGPGNVSTPARLVATGHPSEPDPLGAGNSAFLRHSSGTTGAAKGVLLSHATIIQRVEAANAGLGLGPDDRVLWLLPMAYHFAVSILLYLRVGATLVFGNHLRASVMATIARDERVTFAYGSPYHVRRLADLDAGYDLPRSLRTMVSTTNALDATAAGDFRRRHGIGVRQALGIIEVGLPFLSPGDDGETAGWFAAPLPAYHAMAIDADGRPCAPDVPGELAIAGPGLFDAYLEPWRPRDEVLHDGHFRTGDVVAFDDAGGMRLLGRTKDVINVGGMKVFPLEVEAVLAAHPGVAHCRVRAGADARTGERIIAEIQAQPGHGTPALADGLASWCAQRLAPMKRPADIVLVERLPLTPSGKVSRR